MDYRVLGPLEVIDDGRAVEVPGLKERGVLGLLIVEAGTVVSTDRLVFELWGDEAPSDAVAALRTHVSRVRRALGPRNSIVTQRPGYRLEVERGNIDVARFESLTDRAAKSRSPAEASRLARSALAEWRGPALADLENFLFAETESRHLEERRLTTLETAIDSEMRLGHHARLVAELSSLTAHHPYHETFWAMLMLALYRDGRAGDALDAFREAEAALGEHLGIGPSASLRALERSIVMEDPTLDLSVPAVPNNLPHMVSSFVGRRRELEHLAEALGRSRIVTLTGVGGSGKSRMANELLTRMLGEFQDGVWKVELAPVRDPDAVALAVASGLGEPASHASDVTTSLVDYLATKKILLLLDNCEHLIEPVGALVRTLTAACPNLTILATSREPLHVVGETVWLVSPLDVPDAGDPDEIQEQSEAFRLFVERAESAGRSFAVTSENRSQISELCRELSGLPLAIELAAARITAFTPGRLLEQIRSGLEVLGYGTVPHLDRGSTMHGCIDWSYRLLDNRLAMVFVRLAVFRGGFSIADVASVTAEPVEDSAVDVAALVDKSLVVRDPRRPDRYRLLEPVREFAKSIFQHGDDVTEIRARHANRFLGLAREADSHLRGPNQVMWRDLLEAEHDNLRKAIEWSLDEGNPETALELVSACGWFWFMGGHWNESWVWLSRALDRAGRDFAPARARAVYSTGAWEVIRVKAERVMGLVDEALETCRRHGDRYGEAWCLHLLGHAAMYGIGEDTGLMNDAREIFEELDRPWEVAWSDRYIGDVVGMTDEGSSGLELQLRSISAFRELGDLWSTAFGLNNVGNLIELLPEHGAAAAVPYYERCVRISRDIGDRVWAAHGMRGLAGCAAKLGDADAEMLLVEAIDQLRLIGDDACVSRALGLLGELQGRRGRAAEAAPNIAEAVRLRHRMGEPTGVIVNLERLAWLAAHQGHDAAAARIVSAIDPVASEWGPMVSPYSKALHTEMLGLVEVADTGESVADLVPWALELAEMLAHDPS